MGDWDFVLISLLFVDDEHEFHRKKKKNILDIAKTFLSLWILLNGGYSLGRFLDLVYRINLRASGVRCMKLRGMIRG